jgi:hypothetical protein
MRMAYKIHRIRDKITNMSIIIVISTGSSDKICYETYGNLLEHLLWEQVFYGFFGTFVLLETLVSVSA